MRIEAGGAFFDTNVIVYAFDAADPIKQRLARAAMEAAMQADRFVISTQVMQEFYNVAQRRRLMGAAHAAQVLQRLAEFPVVPADADSVLRALSLQQRDSLSVWDALIVQAALDARCAVLCSEDLQEGRRFASSSADASPLQVVSPFGRDRLDPFAVHEPAPAYPVPAKTRRR